MLKKDKKIEYEHQIFKIDYCVRKQVEEFNKKLIDENWEVIDFKNRGHSSNYSLIHVRRIKK